MMLSFVTKCVVVAATLVSGASAFSVSTASAGARQSPRLAATTTQQQQSMTMLGPGGRVGDALPMSRRDVLGAAFGVAASSFAFVNAADAKDDAALKGTKGDPEFVTCVSDCMYYCTKSKQPPRSRQECIPECRQSCAKTKAQSLVGAPRE